MMWYISISTRYIEDREYISIDPSLRGWAAAIKTVGATRMRMASTGYDVAITRRKHITLSAVINDDSLRHIGFPLITDQ